MKRLLSGVIALILPLIASGADFDYGLVPRKIADDTYVLLGKTEDFSRSNGGNIVNTAFVVTDAGVVVIDTGATRRYGEQLRQAIARVTSQPVIRVFNTHHHPDHFLGNQGFNDVAIAALPVTIQGQREEGTAFVDNVFRLSGDWAKGTEPLAAAHPVGSGVQRIGEREFELIGLSGHTAGDLAIFDRKTRVLFAGDLVFYNRAPTTPHATLTEWQKALTRLESIPYVLMVPGHGEPVPDGRAIRLTGRYLAWIEKAFRAAADRGVEMTEVLMQPIPSEFADLPMAQIEFARSVAHLYRSYEAVTLSPSR